MHYIENNMKISINKQYLHTDIIYEWYMYIDIHPIGHCTTVNQQHTKTYT